jgi:hypothetical protein
MYPVFGTAAGTSSLKISSTKLTWNPSTGLLSAPSVSAQFNGTLGITTPAAAAVTTLSASGQITSTLATGTAPFSIASTTVVPNLNVSQLLGKTWAVPAAIGSTTPNTGAFTAISASGQITSTLATGTAPLSIASTTVVPNLNVSQLLGSTWAAPAAIGSTTPADGTFANLNGNTSVESHVQFTGQITMRPNDTRSASSRNWATSVNQSAFGDWCLRVSTTNTNDPSVVKLQYSGGLVVTDGFGCNGKTAQTAYSLGAAATDLASVITLANNLRTMAINNGIGA